MARRSRVYRAMLIAMLLVAVATAAPISTGSSTALTSGVTWTTRSTTWSSRAMTSTRIVTSDTSARTSNAGPPTSTANQSASRATHQPSRGASTSADSEPSSVRSAKIVGTNDVSHSTARKVSTARSPKPTKTTSARQKASSRTAKAVTHHTTKSPTRSTHIGASSTRTRSAKSTLTRAASKATHSPHTSAPHAQHTPHHNADGDKVISHPIPGSTWERVRRILLIPLSIMTVLTFLAGIGLYIAATWGSGEGWFGKDLNGGEKLGGTPGDIKVLVEEKKKQLETDERTEEKKEEKETGRRNSDGSFQFRVPSLDGDPAKQS